MQAGQSRSGTKWSRSLTVIQPDKFRPVIAGYDFFKPFGGLMKHLPVSFAAAVITTLLLLSPVTLAQTAADLSGVTRDTNGAIVPKVKVVARNTATNFTRESESDNEGRYAFPSLPIGNYEITGSSAGFQTGKVETQLTIGQKTELEIVMTPGGVSANVI